MLRSANIWVLMESFVKEDGLVHAKLRDAALGINTEANKTRNKERVLKKDKFLQLVSNYTTISRKDFLLHCCEWFMKDMLWM